MLQVLEGKGRVRSVQGLWKPNVIKIYIERHVLLQACFTNRTLQFHPSLPTSADPTYLAAPLLTFYFIQAVLIFQICRGLRWKKSFSSCHILTLARTATPPFSTAARPALASWAWILAPSDFFTGVSASYCKLILEHCTGGRMGAVHWACLHGCQASWNPHEYIEIHFTRSWPRNLFSWYRPAPGNERKLHP